LGSVPEPAAPFVDAGSGNFLLTDAALSRGTNLPVGYENLATTTYNDRGAAQVDAPTAAAIATATWVYANRTTTA
jgi:hypothetical protein